MSCVICRVGWGVYEREEEIEEREGARVWVRERGGRRARKRGERDKEARKKNRERERRGRERERDKENEKN